MQLLVSDVCKTDGTFEVVVRKVHHLALYTEEKKCNVQLRCCQQAADGGSKVFEAVGEKGVEGKDHLGGKVLCDTQGPIGQGHARQNRVPTVCCQLWAVSCPVGSRWPVTEAIGSFELHVGRVSVVMRRRLNRNIIGLASPHPPTTLPPHVGVVRRRGTIWPQTVM